MGGGTARGKKLRAGWEGVLGVQVQEMEYVDVPEGTGKGAWQRRQAGGLDVWVTGGGEAVLQLQHREDVGTGWGAERAVQMQTDRALWLEPGWSGKYRVGAGGHPCRGWHMTWQADKGEGVLVRKEWGGELSEGGQDASGVRAQFTRAALTPAPTTQGHSGQELVYTFSEEMTLKAAEAIKMVLDEGRRAWPTARTMCTRTRGTRGITRSRGTTAWRVYRHCQSVRGKALRYRPSPEWQKNGCGRWEEWNTRSGQWGPFDVQGTAGGNG